MRLPKSVLFFSVCYWIGLVIYAWFSYSLTAPNLILSQSLTFLNFQWWMWHTFFDHRDTLVYTYAAIITGLWLIYGGLAWSLWQSAWRPNKLSHFLCGLSLMIAPLLFANNALSYDVFNYIFNAKMVVVYHANPHVKVPLDFADDPWVRFMHNTHTPAPYGYGWTLFSVLPYVAGLGKFLLTWEIFRGLSWVSLLLLAAACWWLIKNHDHETKSIQALWLICLNPLMIIELISNSHNDLWMMVPALVSLGLVMPKVKVLSWLEHWWLRMTLSLLLLGFSVSIKFASILLLPLWLFFLVQQWPSLVKACPKKWLDFINRWWPVGVAVAFLVPLLTDRSQQFHPWYWSWLGVWLPCWVWLPQSWSGVKKTVLVFIIALSLSSLYRYIPGLWLNHYTDEVALQEKMITWTPAIILAIIWAGKELLSWPHRRRR